MKTSIEEVRELWCKADRAISRVEMAATTALEDGSYADDYEKSELLGFIDICVKFYELMEG